MLLEYDYAYHIKTNHLWVDIAKGHRDYHIVVLKQNKKYYPYGNFSLFDLKNNVCVSSCSCPQYCGGSWARLNNYPNKKNTILSKIDNNIFYSNSYNINDLQYKVPGRKKHNYIAMLWLRGTHNERYNNDLMNGDVDCEVFKEDLQKINDLLEKYERYIDELYKSQRLNV